MAFPSPASPSVRPRKSAALVIFLCFLAIVFDGYDLVVYGAIVPKLLAYQPWGLTPVQTGAIGSYALAGMFIGAILIGYLTDVVGRRKIMMVSIASFSVLMLLTAWAPTPELFGLFRFLAGLGLGGVIPTAIALTVEFSKLNRRNFNNALMFSGYAVGGILAAARLASANQSSGTGDVNLNAIAAAVIGGTSLFGGRGSAFAALVGVVVIQSISSGLTLLNLDSSVQFMVTGVVLVLAVIVDSISRRARAVTGLA